MTPPPPAANLHLKRAYQPAAPGDGARILIDRLWPRGVSRDRADLDDWAKEIAPSTELRQWFHHQPDLWPEFQRRYRAELQAHGPKLDEIRDKARAGVVTLIYATREEDRNHGIVLRKVLLNGA